MTAGAAADRIRTGDIQPAGVASSWSGAGDAPSDPFTGRGTVISSSNGTLAPSPHEEPFAPVATPERIPPIASACSIPGVGFRISGPPPGAAARTAPPVSRPGSDRPGSRYSADAGRALGSRILVPRARTSPVGNTILRPRRRRSVTPTSEAPRAGPASVVVRSDREREGSSHGDAADGIG